MCVGKRKRSVYKGNVVALEEAFLHVRWYIWCCWEFGIACYVDAMQRDFAVLGVAEDLAIDAQAM